MAKLHGAVKSTFSVAVVYTPSMDTRPELMGEPVSFQGVFEEAREVEKVMGRGLEIGYLRPMVEFIPEDLGISPLAGDLVVVGGVSYEVLEPQESLGKMTLLILERQVTS